jgi:hypothetical protein
VPLRIGFDLDGVLADMDAELTRQAEILFGHDAARPLPERRAGAQRETAADVESPSAPPLRIDLSARQQRRLWQHVESIENFWETLSEVEAGAVARLAAAASQRRWEIIFLTKRPQSAGYTAQVQSQRWLASKGFPLPSVYVVQGSRGRIASALDLDIVVDDRAENCLDVVMDSKSRAILVWRDDEKLLPAAARRLGIGVVKSIGECLEVLTRVDRSEADRQGIVSRLMRLLGRKEPASVS